MKRWNLKLRIDRKQGGWRKVLCLFRCISKGAPSSSHDAVFIPSYAIYKISMDRKKGKTKTNIPYLRTSLIGFIPLAGKFGFEDEFFLNCKGAGDEITYKPRDLVYKEFNWFRSSFLKSWMGGLASTNEQLICCFSTVIMFALSATVQSPFNFRVFSELQSLSLPPGSLLLLLLVMTLITDSSVNGLLLPSLLFGGRFRFGNIFCLVKFLKLRPAETSICRSFRLNDGGILVGQWCSEDADAEEVFSCFWYLKCLALMMLFAGIADGLLGQYVHVCTPGKVLLIF